MTTNPRRRWFQYSLKGLMLLVLVAAVPCGWLKWKIDRKARERAAIAEIEKLGGHAVYDWEWHSPGTPPPQPPGAAWVRRLLGDDFFTDISEITSFYATKEMGDECLAHLDSLTGLTTVNLLGSQVTDDGLTHLTRLPNLTAVRLGDSHISDKGLIHVAKLPRLVQLGLWNTDVTDAGIADLKTLTQLESLYLEGTGVTDAGVAELQKALPKCEIIR